MLANRETKLVGTAFMVPEDLTKEFLLSGQLGESVHLGGGEHLAFEAGVANSKQLAGLGKFGNRLGDRHRILRGQGDAAVFLEHVLNGIMHTIGEGDAGQRVLDDEILAAALIEFRTEPRQLFHRHPLEICHYHKEAASAFALICAIRAAFSDPFT